MYAAMWAIRCRRQPTLPNPTATASTRTRASSRGLGEEERGPSVLDQRHQKVRCFTFCVQVPLSHHGRHSDPACVRASLQRHDGQSTTMVTARITTVPSSTVKRDEQVGVSWVLDAGCAAFRGGSEQRCPQNERLSCLGWKASISSITGTILGRGQTVYGDTGTPNATFGQFVAVGAATTNAIPAFANIDPPRMFQLQARFIF